VWKDLNGDGRDDVVFLLTQEGEGSGTFFYVVAALATDAGYIGSEGVLLGDRIAPQTTESGTGKIVVVNYAVRAPGEPFTTLPSIGKSIWLLFDPASMQFGEVAQNFEGEADPSVMTLTMKAWDWIAAQYNDGTEIVPKKAGVFTLTFLDDGTFGAKTDCNSMSGGYTATKSALSFGPIASTKMYCEGSQEADFSTLLMQAQEYHFTSKGELIIDLKLDSGSVVFK
jgi:Heat shock protein